MNRNKTSSDRLEKHEPNVGDQPQCPACLAKEAERIGEVYHGEPLQVAHVVLDFPAIPFFLYRCKSCSFQFKNPTIPAEKLLDCYERAAGDRWEVDVDPIERNYDRILAAIQAVVPQGRLLDVGCSHGTFLKYVSAKYQPFGIEPSTEAAEMTRSLGFDILGGTIGDLDSDSRFDVIVAMDVLEHLPDPREFFESVSKHLNLGGIFVATTGNTDAWSWKLQKARYWYCAFPEHVSFYNSQSLERLAKEFDMCLKSTQRMSYKRSSLSRRMLQNIKGIVFTIGVRLKWLGVARLRRKYARRVGTGWTASWDHAIAVIQKNGR